MIQLQDDFYLLHTEHTSYFFHILESGQPEHIYYGSRISGKSLDFLLEKHAHAPGNTIAYAPEHQRYTLENLCLECSGYGKGDIREPFIELLCQNGSSSTDFVFERSEIRKGKLPLPGLPSSYDEEGQAEQLLLTLRDRNHGFTLELCYTVFPDCDIITRSARFLNSSEEPVRLNRLMSAQVDFNLSGYDVTTFTGSWIKEMQKHSTRLTAGKLVNASFTGGSSSRANPFVLFHAPDSTERHGDCYGFNLIYSGNHYEAFEVNSFEKTRGVLGINPTNFSFLLAPGEAFQAPEAVLSYSPAGFDGLSQNMHRFVREHIVRGIWKKKERPVLLNSWEAAYFNINEDSLLKLAKAGKEVGIELFVMDDGWFGNRSDDHRALGDWTENREKLPNGLSGLAEKIRELGLDFGIWIEPEMVNVDSELYRAHPDWSVEIPGMPHAEGRNQRILDLCNPEVVGYLTESIRRVLSSAPISYVKWDMNRIFSDYYSPYLPAEKQQEMAHRYILGVYQLAKNLTESFPEILFEGCAAGGNRFDLGMLCYFPQIWGSDNTDALSRLRIQEGYSYGYPLSTVSAHVSACPNHQTLRTTPLSTRFAVASFGVLGYECNLTEMPETELQEIREQISLYKAHRKCWQFGDFHRIESGDTNIHQWITVSPDKTESVGMLLQKEMKANSPYQSFHPTGLAEEKLYRFHNHPADFDAGNFGIMPGECEDYLADGASLMRGGVSLREGFASTGLDEEVRKLVDYDSRLYFIEEVD